MELLAKCLKLIRSVLLFTCLLSTTFGAYESTKVFPPEFLFGVSSAAYQVEGGWNAGGKGENIWDRYTHEHPEYITDKSNGDVACDSYNKWAEDIQLCKDLGVDFYRFSLSWSRILPKGTADFINEDGIRYYNNLIDGLLSKGIRPFVTLYHWDLPQPLQDLGGWTNPQIAEYYEDFADLAFKLFGDRVKVWITFNGAIEICRAGYDDTIAAPALGAGGIGGYLCGKTVLLSHAKVYHLYQEKYKSTQDGVIGIIFSGDWGEPKTKADAEAAERKMHMGLGWWANPIFSKSGNYPKILIDRVANVSQAEGFPKSRLPPFSQEEIDYIRGSADFMGLNIYTSFLVEDADIQINEPSSYMKDMGVKFSQDASWKGSSAEWLKVVPWGLRKLLNWVKNTYDNPVVYVTENGFADTGEIEDTGRIDYYKSYLNALLEAIHEDGCNVKTYSAWSLTDNFEWGLGYTQKFGLYHVDFNDSQRPRTPKASARFFKKLISSRVIPQDEEEQSEGTCWKDHCS